MDAILNQIEKEKQERVLSLDLESKSYTERSVSYGVSNRIIDRQKRANPRLTRDMLNNYKRSKSGGNADGMPSTINLNSSIESNISDLSDPAAPPEISLALNDSPEASKPRKKGGRPKGSTAANKATLKRSKQLALNYAANEMVSVKHTRTKVVIKCQKVLI